MTTIICEMDSMELCVWKEKHLQSDQPPVK